MQEKNFTTAKKKMDREGSNPQVDSCLNGDGDEGNRCGDRGRLDALSVQLD